MTTYRGALGVLAVASNAGCVVVWGAQVAIYASIEEARDTVGDLQPCKLSADEAGWIARRIGEAEAQLKRIMWG